jgi:hypothetical protein
MSETLFACNPHVDAAEGLNWRGRGAHLRQV